MLEPSHWLPFEHGDSPLPEGAHICFARRVAQKGPQDGFKMLQYNRSPATQCYIWPTLWVPSQNMVPSSNIIFPHEELPWNWWGGERLEVSQRKVENHRWGAAGRHWTYIQQRYERNRCYSQPWWVWIMEPKQGRAGASETINKNKHELHETMPMGTPKFPYCDACGTPNGKKWRTKLLIQSFPSAGIPWSGHIAICKLYPICL